MFFFFDDLRRKLDFKPCARHSNFSYCLKKAGIKKLVQRKNLSYLSSEFFTFLVHWKHLSAPHH